MSVYRIEEIMRLDRQERQSSIIAAILAVPIIVLLSASILALSEFVSLIVTSLIAGIAASLVWGFKPRFHETRAEDRLHTRQQKTRSETTKVKDQEKMRYTIKLRVDEYEEYYFDFNKGARITGKLSADGEFSAYFLTESSRRSFQNGYNFTEIDGIENAYYFEPNFVADRRGTYFVILVNEDRKSIKVDVDLDITYG